MRLHYNTHSFYKMEELGVLDLLECPLCLEKLDVSAKVLPCQHTFCKTCLQKQEGSSPQLCCPECHTPAQARSVEDLPANLLLVRLLESLLQTQAFSGSRGDPARSRESARFMVPSLGGNGLPIQHREKQDCSEDVFRADDGKKLSRHLERMTDDIISLRQKVDENVHYGAISSSISGLAPSSVVTSQQVRTGQQYQYQPQQQQLSPQSPLTQTALCKALFDFDPEQLNLEDCKGCLTFFKGDILPVIRRVDEDWIEGKLGDRVGIFPLQFTEPNSVAATLLEVKNRKWSDSSESRPRIGSDTVTKPTINTADISNRTAISGAPQGPSKIPNVHAVPLLWTPQQTHPPQVSSLNRQLLVRPPRLPGHHSSLQHPGTNSQNVKRRSHHTHRHQSHGDRKMNREPPPTITMALINPQTSFLVDTKQPSSTQQLSISVCAALYSYKPRQPEELELRKGEMVGVYGKFKEGWLRGLSLRTGKVGILPGNYVTPVLKTSARLLESKVGSATSGTVPGKRTSGSKGPAGVLALDRVNSDRTSYSTGPVTSGPMGPQPVMSSTGAGRMSLNGGSQGWDTVRRAFHTSHRGSTQRGNHYATYTSGSGFQSHTKGFSPALPRKKLSSNLSVPGRPLGWMSEATAPSAGGFLKDKDTAARVTLDRQGFNGPQSILVKPESQKSQTDKPTKSVRFFTQEECSPLAAKAPSQGPASSLLPSCPLEVWAPSLTLGRDGPGISLKEGKPPVLRSSGEDGLTSTQRCPSSFTPSLSSLSASTAASVQSSPSRHRLASSYLAKTESELSLMQGEVVLVHRHRPDGRVLVTQESSGQTGLFHSSVLQFLERLS